uniref:Uncharacterized protein n=1 Tax=Anguilla anguilla TaxID=7936 RepID=A0A0E9W1W7_ANGAN
MKIRKLFTLKGYVDGRGK